MESKLYRDQAIQHRLDRSLGTLSLNVPIRLRVLSVVLVILILLLVAFVSIVPFAEKISVRGYVDIEQGISAIYSTKRGIIKSIHVKEGQSVHKGDKLIIITEDPLFSMGSEIEHTKDDLINQKTNLSRELSLKQSYLKSLEHLYNKKYITTQKINEIRTEILELKNRIQSIDIDIIALNRKLYYPVTSPVDGTITGIQYTVGHYVDVNKPLFRILPMHSKLVLKLFVPIEDILFIHKNVKAGIEYDAYPVSLFGISMATINHIDMSPASDNQEKNFLKSGKVYYKVTATLDKRNSKASRRKIRLTPGMTLSALIPGQKKSITRWLFDPTYDRIKEYML